MVKKRTTSLFLLAFYCLSSQLSATTIESIEEIRLAAKKFLEEKQVSADKENIEVTIGNIDSRLRLAKCDAPLTFFLPQANKLRGKTTVGIRCNGSKSWKIYVSANVIEHQSAWVLSRNVASGEMLTEGDLVKTKIAVSDTRKIPMTDLKQVLNASVKRTMRAGSPIYQGNLCLVCRGDKVSVSATNEYFSINVEAIAMGDALLGETVNVKNPSSRKVFGATVVGKNQLNVKIASTN